MKHQMEKHAHTEKENTKRWEITLLYGPPPLVTVANSHKLYKIFHRNKLGSLE